MEGKDENRRVQMGVVYNCRAMEVTGFTSCNNRKDEKDIKRLGYLTEAKYNVKLEKKDYTYGVVEKEINNQENRKTKKENGICVKDVEKTKREKVEKSLKSNKKREVSVTILNQDLNDQRIRANVLKELSHNFKPSSDKLKRDESKKIQAILWVAVNDITIPNEMRRIVYEYERVFLFVVISGDKVSQLIDIGEDMSCAMVDRVVYLTKEERTVKNDRKNTYTSGKYEMVIFRKYKAKNKKVQFVDCPFRKQTSMDVHVGINIGEIIYTSIEVIGKMIPYFKKHRLFIARRWYEQWGAQIESGLLDYKYEVNYILNKEGEIERQKYCERKSKVYKLRYMESKELNHKVKDIRELNEEGIANLGYMGKEESIFNEAVEGMTDLDFMGEIGYGENTDINPNEKGDIIKTIEDQIGRIVKEGNVGITLEQIQEYKEMLIENFEAFGLESSLPQMSLLTPIKVELIDGHIPCLTKGRHMASQEEDIFIQKKLKDLCRMGICKPSKNPIYGCTGFTVPKKGPKKYRLVINLKPLNKITVPTAIEMPNLEKQLGYLGNAEFFSSFDILSGYDFLQTEAHSRKFFNIITPFGSYEMHGCPMGWCNSAQLFQNRLMTEVLQPADLFGQKHNGACQWIDDTLIYGDNFDIFMKTVEKFLKGIRLKRVRLNIRKCELLKKDINWCGRRLRKGQWTYKKEFYDKILSLPRPRYADEMCKAFYIATWLGPTIPGLTKYRELFKKYLNLEGGTLKQLMRKNRIIEWTEERYTKWMEFLATIKKSSENFLKNYDSGQALIAFADASEQYWSLIVGQDTYTNLERAIEQGTEYLKFKPMIFLGGEFKKNELHWHITAKEFYPFICGIKRLDFILTCHPKPIHLFTDHKNLIFILKPHWTPKYSHINRLKRWAMILQSINCEIHHIEGRTNILADIMSRWYVTESNLKDIEKSKAVQTMIPRRGEYTSRVRYIRKVTKNKQLKLFENYRISFLNPYYKGLIPEVTRDNILRAQNTSINTSMEYNTETRLYEVNGKIYIPEGIIEEVIVKNHILSGHSSIDNELKKLKNFMFEKLSTKGVRNYIENLYRICIHCQRVPKLIKTHFAITDMAKEPRDILIMDYLYIYNKEYILVIMDAFSRLMYLRICKKANAEETVNALLEFRAMYGFKNNFKIISDKGSHFANQVLESLEKKLRYSHNFSISYAPWSNGAIEVANATILKYVRQLLSEYGLLEKEWKSIIPIVQYLINSKKMTRRLNMSPFELMLGFKDNIKLYTDEALCIYNKGELVRPATIKIVKGVVDKIKREIDGRKNEIYNYVSLLRTKDNKRRNKRRVPILNFQAGDWVLVSRANTPKDDVKVQLKWNGPYMVKASISDHLYELVNLFNKKITCHASRMWYYEGSEYIPDEGLKYIFLNDSALFEVKEFKGVRWSSEYKTYEVLVSWKGFEKEDESYEPILDMYKYVPDLLSNFIDKLKESKLKKRLEKYLKKEAKTEKINRISYKEDPEEGLYTDRESMNTHGWLPIELRILKLCILKYGVGNYKQMLGRLHIPSKNKAQLYARTQRLLGVQAIREYHGIKLDVDEVKKDNKCRYGTEYYIAREERDETDIAKLRDNNKIKYERKAAATIEIPYFRNLNNRYSLALFLREMNNIAQRNKLTNEVEDKNREMERFFTQMKDKLRGLNVYANNKEMISQRTFKYYREVYTKILKVIKKVYPYSINDLKNIDFGGKREIENDITMTIDKIDYLVTIKVYKYPRKETIYVSTDLYQKGVFFGMEYIITNPYRYMDKIRVIDQLNNIYICIPETSTNEGYELYIKPESSKAIIGDVFSEEIQNKLKTYLEEAAIVILDPPWKGMNSDPVRGPAIKYDTLTDAKIYSLEVIKYMSRGILLYWCLNRNLKEAKGYLKRMGFSEIMIGDWIKITKNGLLKPSLGYYMSHVKESFILVEKGIRGAECKIRDILIWKRGRQSEKPVILYELLEKLKKDLRIPGKCIEIFGRKNNLRKGWITFGLEV